MGLALAKKVFADNLALPGRLADSGEAAQLQEKVKAARQTYADSLSRASEQLVERGSCNTLVGMQTLLSSVTTRSKLSEGLKEAFRRMGIEVSQPGAPARVPASR